VRGLPRFDRNHAGRGNAAISTRHIMSFVADKRRQDGTRVNGRRDNA
jgi:hypothetical protein